MNPLGKVHVGTRGAEAAATSVDDWRLERLIDRLPKPARSTVRFVRQPSGRWLRIPTALLLTLGGIL